MKFTEKFCPYLQGHNNTQQSSCLIALLSKRKFNKSSYLNYSLERNASSEDQLIDRFIYVTFQNFQPTINMMGYKEKCYNILKYLTFCLLTMKMLFLATIIFIALYFEVRFLKYILFIWLIFTSLPDPGKNEHNSARNSSNSIFVSFTVASDRFVYLSDCF